MQSIEDKIFVKIKKCGRGKEFFASDFVACGESKFVSKALANPVKKQVLIKLATGIFFIRKLTRNWDWTFCILH